MQLDKQRSTRDEHLLAHIQDVPANPGGWEPNSQLAKQTVDTSSDKSRTPLFLNMKATGCFTAHPALCVISSSQCHQCNNVIRGSWENLEPRCFHYLKPIDNNLIFFLLFSLNSYCIKTKMPFEAKGGKPLWWLYGGLKTLTKKTLVLRHIIVTNKGDVWATISMNKIYH